MNVVLVDLIFRNYRKGRRKGRRRVHRAKSRRREEAGPADYRLRFRGPSQAPSLSRTRKVGRGQNERCVLHRKSFAPARSASWPRVSGGKPKPDEVPSKPAEKVIAFCGTKRAAAIGRGLRFPVVWPRFPVPDHGIRNVVETTLRGPSTRSRRLQERRARFMMSRSQPIAVTKLLPPTDQSSAELGVFLDHTKDSGIRWTAFSFSSAPLAQIWDGSAIFGSKAT